MSAFSKLLIANRGEIAVRIIRTARELGYRTVAVYSAADSEALHVECADKAVYIGPSPAAESYLCVDKVLDAAKRCGADAIHPGYGFLSENAAFAKACKDADILFIGPTAEAIELMGSKRLSKLAMLEAGVPCILGYQGEDQSDDGLLREARDIGFPLMVKASAGGGGRGMRLVLEESELKEQIRTARSEAQAAFGSGELILEHAVLEPRHIEIQVFADNFGNVVYLGERDCSIQRRHQKVVEEAPSPFITEELRQQMGQAAVDAARACGYRGAGTVEFLVDNERNFYFLEMNTRLQVEHPVTELVTGLDLVAWQLAVASGRSLPLSQDDIQLSGHAMEVRLYAEDPRQNFLPQTGEIRVWEYPRRVGIRVDHGIQANQSISPFYDPMVAKVIAYGGDREEARRKLASAVEDTVLVGVNSNKLFLKNILRHPVFIAGEASTAFIEQHFQIDPSVVQTNPLAETWANAALVYYVLSARDRSGHRSGWSSAVQPCCDYRLQCQDVISDITLTARKDDYEVTVGETKFALQVHRIDDVRITLSLDGVRRCIHFSQRDKILFLDDGHGHFCFDDITQIPSASVEAVGSGEVKATMDGAIVNIAVTEGEVVQSGQTLLILEAMKMEHPLKSSINGAVRSISVKLGDQVKSKQLLALVVESEEVSSNV